MTPYDAVVEHLSRWVLASAGAAPILLIGGWTVAGAQQPPGYDPVRDTISALAAYGSTDRWIMTSALAGLGICYIVTAASLLKARSVGRMVLAGGGVATIAVATFPQPLRGNSVAHTVMATVAFLALATWPLFAARHDLSSSFLAPKVSVAVALIMLGLVGWFVSEIHGGQRGLAERVAAGAEALWPLVVVIRDRRVRARTLAT